MWRDSSEFLVYSSFECLLQTTPPVSAPNVTKARGPCLRDWRHLLAIDPNVVPEGREMHGGEERVGRGEFWSLQLIKPVPQSSALIGSLLPEASGLLAMHLEVDECGNGV